jgi:osmotically inducible protein OsmC
MNHYSRKASVDWTGLPRGPAQFLTCESGTLDNHPLDAVLFSRPTSKASAPELLAAAHAGSYSCSLLNELGLHNAISGKISTTSTVRIEEQAGRVVITGLHLNILATLPHILQAEFIAATIRAKSSCLISVASSVEISISARLED